MPELVEVEIYRAALECVVGSVISAVDAPDEWFLKGATTAERLNTAVVGGRVTAARRRGKLLLLDIDAHPAGSVSLGLRFGMTGRLSVGGKQPIDELLYSTTSSDERFVRFTMVVDGDLAVSIIDPRRLGGVELDPDEDRLGPDAASISAAEMRHAMRGERAIKAVLLDQARVAGVGNLICDETLWRMGLSPVRSASSLGAAEVEALAKALRETIADLTVRGGSHMGDLQDHRAPGTNCPVDGEPLRRDDVGGRTTYWCPAHQR